MWAGNEAGWRRGLGMRLGRDVGVGWELGWGRCGLGMRLGEMWAGNEAGGRCGRGLGMRLGGDVDVGWE